MALTEDVRVGKNDSFIVPWHTQKVMPIRLKKLFVGAAVCADTRILTSALSNKGTGLKKKSPIFVPLQASLSPCCRCCLPDHPQR